MSPRRRRRSKRTKDYVLYIGGGVLIVTALTAMAAIGWGYLTAERPPELDPVTACPVEGPAAVTAIIIDATDELPELARKQVARLISETASDVPRHGLLEIRAVAPGTAGGTVVFSKCSPGDGSGISELTGNPALMERRWKEKFDSPLGSAIPQALSGGEAPRSPIMETIQAVAVERFEGSQVENAPKRLLVVSDMLQHGKDYSHYSSGLSYERFQASDAYQRVRTDLHGAEVTILYVQRKTRAPINSLEHIAFWIRWINDNGGQFIAADKLQGLGT